MTNLEKYINTKIVVSSSEVVQLCVDTFGITEINARKRIHRLPSNIYKIKGICSNNQSIMYDKDNWGNEEFWDKLLHILEEHAKQHYFIINALKLHCGIIEKDKLASYTASPIRLTKGHKYFSSIIDDLMKLKLIEENSLYYILSSNIDCIKTNDKKAKSLNLVQKITMDHFHEWARNIGLISYDSAKFDAEFSRYQFGMVAPSYIKSLVSKPAEKTIPAFVLVDIVIDNSINEKDVIFFVKKLENIYMQNQSAKFIPFLLLSSHSQHVNSVLKSNGIIIGNIDELFGEKYSETVLGIMNLIENAGAIIKKNPEYYIKLIDNIEKLAIGKTYNLKGDLFEMAVGYYHGQLCQSLEISKVIYYESEQKEIDVYAIYQDKVVFAECKGYNTPIDDEYIESWLSKKIHVIRKWALSCESLKNKKIEFEIWCTGGFTESSTFKLEEAKNKTKKYAINFFTLDSMRRVAREKGLPHFDKIIKTYYIK